MRRLLWTSLALGLLACLGQSAHAQQEVVVLPGLRSQIQPVSGIFGGGHCDTGCAPTHKVCVSVPSKIKTSTTIYSSKPVDYCLTRCSLQGCLSHCCLSNLFGCGSGSGLFGGRDCGHDGCGQRGCGHNGGGHNGCGPNGADCVPQARCKNALLKKVIIEECEGFTCKVEERPGAACDSGCGRFLCRIRGRCDCNGCNGYPTYVTPSVPQKMTPAHAAPQHETIIVQPAPARLAPLSIAPTR
ncbi:MAG: hypothetical protein L0Y72_25730 [Gemmataceae bacterium]|nr:hypothetical protein [Gemmataceae bacterium]MCI0742448.1 hypothetical protein [Gemmataceae bacterium]